MPSSDTPVFNTPRVDNVGKLETPTVATSSSENMDSTDLSIANFEKENEEKNKYFLKKEKELFEKGKGSVGLDAMDESHNDINPSEESIDVEISPVDSEVLQPPADQEKKNAGSVPDATSSFVIIGGEKLCCMAMTANCLACHKDVTVEEFCAMTDNYEVPGCPGKQNIEMDDVMTEIPTLTSPIANGGNAVDIGEMDASDTNNILQEIEDVPSTSGENAYATNVETILSQIEDKPQYTETAAASHQEMMHLTFFFL